MSRYLKGIGFLSFLFLICIFLVACPFPSGMHPETAGITAATGNITGKVLAQGQKDNSGVAVAAELTDGIKSVSVQKTISARQAIRAVIATQATTDASGTYTLTGLPAGVYTLNAVSKDGIEKAVVTSVTVGAGSTTQAVLMILTQTGQIRGTVTLRGGSDPTGIVVFIAGTSYSAMTDRNGNYLMSNVPAGRNYTLVASREGYDSVIKSVDVTVNKTKLMESIELQPYVDEQTAGSVSGTAKLEDAPTSAGIFVYLVGTSHICVTDRDGNFSLTGLASKSYTIMASKDGYSAQSRDVVVPKGPLDSISFTLISLGPYYVTYDPNEGSGTVPIDPTNYLQGFKVTVLGSGSLVRAGYSFAGWQVDGTGSTYTQGQTFVMGTSSITLYAVWIAGGTGPAAPTGVTATAVSTTEIDISWSAVTGATSYNLYWSTTTGVSKTSYTTKVTGVTSPAPITELTLGTTYYCVVTAVNLDGESAESAQVSATPAPYINANIIVNAADGASFMEQVMVLTSSSGSPIAGATVEANGTLFKNTGKRYEGSLAIAKGAAVTLTVTVSGVTYGASATQFSEYPNVSAPTSDAIWQRDSANTISWSGGFPTTGAYYLVGVADGNGHTVYGDHGHPYIVPISTTSASVPANTLTTTPPYVVTVGIVNGTMSGSGEVTGGTSIPNALPGSSMLVGGMSVIPITLEGSEAAPAPIITATAVSTTEIDISWSSVPGANSYNLYWSTTPGVTPANGHQILSITSTFKHTALTIGTTYYYVATAVNGNGESATASAQVSALTAPYIQASLFVNAANGIPFNGSESVVVADGPNGPPIQTATITVNGTDFIWNGAQKAYTPSVGVTIAQNATVNLSVTVDTVTYTASTNQFSAFPNVIKPSADEIWQQGDANIVEWTAGSPTTGASYIVGIQDHPFTQWVWGLGGNSPYYFPTSTLSATVPAATLVPGTYGVVVGIVNASNVVNGVPTSFTTPIANALPSSALVLAGASGFQITVQ